MGPDQHQVAARLDRLPQELLDMVLNNLNTEQQARLGQCNKLLRGRVEPTLFGNPDNRGWAMRWACRGGYHKLILTAIRYGSSPSIIPIHQETLDGETKLIQPSTLAIAAKRNRHATFRFLIDQGARVEHANIHPTSLKCILIYLSKPGAAETLNYLLHTAGLMTDLDQPSLDFLFFNCLKFNSSLQRGRGGQASSPTTLSNLRFMIRAGANLNGKDDNNDHPPLSIVIKQKKWDLFQLLIDEGAEINRVGHYWPKTMPLAVALCEMATCTRTGNGSVSYNNRREAVAKCIEAGADINLVEPTCLEDSHILARDMVKMVMPLIAYIEAVAYVANCNWDRDKVSDLSYLVEELRASPDSVFDRLPDDFRVLSCDNLDLRNFSSFENCGEARFHPVHPVDALTRQFRGRKLSPYDDSYLVEAIKLLVLNGKLRPKKLARFMAPITLDTPDEAASKNSNDWPFFKHWSAILDFVAKASQAHLDEFLGAYIANRATYPARYPDGGALTPLCPLFKATVSHLLKAGANINARIFPCRDSKELCTLLFRLCELYSKFDSFSGPFHSAAYYAGRRTLTDSRASLVAYLVNEAGADPRVPGLCQLGDPRISEMGDIIAMNGELRSRVERFLFPGQALEQGRDIGSESTETKSLDSFKPRHVLVDGWLRYLPEERKQVEELMIIFYRAEIRLDEAEGEKVWGMFDCTLFREPTHTRQSIQFSSIPQNPECSVSDTFIQSSCPLYLLVIGPCQLLRCVFTRLTPVTPGAGRNNKATMWRVSLDSAKTTYMGKGRKGLTRGLF